MIKLVPRKIKTKGEFPLIQIEEGDVQAVLRNSAGDNRIIPGAIVVTWAGQAYYEDEMPLKDVCKFVVGNGLRLGTNDTPLTKNDADVLCLIYGSQNLSKWVGSQKSHGGAYVWTYNYGPGVSLQGIIEGAIVNDLINPTWALTRFVFNERFDKLETDILRIEIRHWLTRCNLWQQPKW